MEVFTRKAMEAIQNIPPGKVMTYGQVASYAGSPRGARQVARILHSMSKKYELPWHRVINSRGEISLRDEDSQRGQEQMLKREGVSFNESGRVDLDIYRFDPGAENI